MNMFMFISCQSSIDLMCSFMLFHLSHKVLLLEVSTQILPC